jgi:hypothetical protein
MHRFQGLSGDLRYPYGQEDRLTPENLLVKVSEPKISLTLAAPLLYLLMTGARD